MNKTHPVMAVPAFDDNYIWLIQYPPRRRVAIVDPGDADPVLETLGRTGLEPAAILITHHHGDHTGGVRDLLAHYDIPVYAPEDRRIPAVTHVVRDGDRVELPDLELTLEVMETPGHTLTHVVYHGDGMLFCGDTLFTGGCGRLFEGTPEQMHRSLSRIAALPPETLVYCAHEYTLANLGFARVVEPDSAALSARRAAAEAARARGEPTVPSTLAEESRTNPFLRSDDPAVVAAASNFAGQSLKNPVEVFATVRHWKDTLD